MHYIFFHGGYFGFDDIEYCRLAHSIIKGNFTHDSLYAHRYAAYLPLALTYLFWGVGDLANFIFGFIIFLITTIIVIKLIHEMDFYTKWIAASMLTFAPMYLMYVEKPMPDIIVALGFLLSFSSYYSHKFDLGLYRRPAILFVAGCIIMFLAKETFLIFYPFFLILFITDLYQKSGVKFWKTTFSGLLIFGMLYFGYSGLFLGDVFARIHHIFAGQYISSCSYDLQPFAATLNRIGYELWFELARNLYLLPLCFVPILWKSDNTKIRFLAKSYVSLLILANFMTISYTTYVPLCPDPRHHIYILPIGALLMAYGFRQIIGLSFNQYLTIISVLFALLILSVYKGFESSWWLYIPLIAAIIFGYKNHKTAMYVCFAISVLSVFVQNCTYNKKVNYQDQKALNDYLINDLSGFKYAITDRVNRDYGNLHSAFDTTLVRFVDYKAADTFRFKTGAPRYLVSNGMTLYLSNTSWESLPESARTAHEKLPKFYENKAGAVYKID